MKYVLAILGIVLLSSCAPTENAPHYQANPYDVKMRHGDGYMTNNFDLHVGKKCELDKEGRSWMSYVWLKSADRNGNFQKLDADKKNCNPL